MFQVVFQALQTPTHFMFIKTLWGRGCYYSHFIYKATVGMEVNSRKKKEKQKMGAEEIAEELVVKNFPKLI